VIFNVQEYEIKPTLKIDKRQLIDKEITAGNFSIFD
jgi:hypothetical protein